MIVEQSILVQFDHQCTNRYARIMAQKRKSYLFKSYLYHSQLCWKNDVITKQVYKKILLKREQCCEHYTLYVSDQ